MAELALLHKTWKSWIGQRVFIKKNAFGTLKYFGEIKFKEGFWCGIELDEPVGENDGMINNMQYFKCKANYGIFVPVSETARLRSTSSEVNPVCDLIKLKYAGCSEHLTKTDGLRSALPSNSAKVEMDDEINKRNSSDLNKTFYKNDLKITPDIFCFKVPKERLPTDNKHENVSKRSKNTCSRLETEESLGIISDLLDEEESWNLLDETTNRIGKKCLIQKSSTEIDIDSVFYPPAETSLLGSRSNLYTEEIDTSIQNCLNSKYTSTPKRCISNVIDLNRTMKLSDKQSYDILHDEPIVAGSSKLNFETDFDLEKFKQSDILCSTLKCSLPSLPIQYSASDELCINTDELALLKKNFKYQEVTKLSDEKCSKISIISNVCVNMKQFASVPNGFIEENSDVLNTTFVINSDSLSSPVANTSLVVKDHSPHAVPESDGFHSDRKSNGVIQMDSTFAIHNCSEKVPEGEKTFIIDCSPIKITKASPLECETIPKKKTLSIIFEKANTENCAIESEDEPNNTTNSESCISSKLCSEDMDQIMKRNSLSKIAASDLNSTFCISSDESMNKKKTAYLDVTKRYSLSSISVNNVCIKKQKSVVTSLKANGQKSITQSRLSVITKKKSLQSSSSTNSPSSLKQFQEINSRDKISTEVSSANKFFETLPKRKLKKTCSTLVESNSDIAYAREQLKKSLEPCRSVDSLGVKKENVLHSILKINKNNSEVVEICKSVSNLPTKIIPKMTFNRKEITSESSKLNRKVNELPSSHQFKSKNLNNIKLDFKHRHSMLPTDLANSDNSNFNRKVSALKGFHENSSDVKPCNVKHRHSMLPSVLSNSTRTKNSVSKDRTDVKCIINAVKSSFASTESKSVPPPKAHQEGFENKRIEREHMEKKCVSEEKVFENDSNNIKYVKKKENLTSLKSKLLKPGTLSRLPVPDKLSKKPGCILNTVDPQSRHSIKSVNKTDNQRIYRRLPLQKLQDKH